MLAAEAPPNLPRPPRPVTPVGIAAEELGAALEELEGVAAVPSGALDRLRRAYRLVAGLDAYAASCTTPESPALRHLAEVTAAEDWEGRTSEVFLEREMLSGHVEGQFLAALVHATRARQVLEIGMFTGYSALAMAEALPDDGGLVACEIDPGVAALARSCFAASPASGRIEVRLGPARDTLSVLATEGASFDLVFIDADKGGYAGYLDQILEGGLLGPGGLICVDNTLLQGQPWVDPAPSAPGRAIAQFNAAVAADPRIAQVLVPIRDGVTLLRRSVGP